MSTPYRVWEVPTYSWACEWPGCRVAGSGHGSEEVAHAVANAHREQHERLDPEGFYLPELFPEQWRA